MPSSKAIQLILARQLASCVAMPIFLMDEDGTLIFYNEPAETLLNHRFEETGEISADEFLRLVAVADEDRRALPPDERPTRVALLERRPVSRTIWSKAADSEWRHLQVTAFPLVGEGDRMLGVMNIFWEI